MDVFEAIHGRRSIRAYRSTAVDRALIEDFVWAAAQAPSPPVSGDQPWTFCVIEGVDLLSSYGTEAKEYARAHRPEGILPKHWSWAEQPAFKVFWDAPVLVLICGRVGSPEAILDCCRAGQNLMLAVYAKGLGSCWVGAAMPWLCSTGVAGTLGIPAGFAPAVPIVLGYAAETPAGNPRPRSSIHWTGNADPTFRRPALPSART